MRLSFFLIFAVHIRGVRAHRSARHIFAGLVWSCVCRDRPSADAKQRGVIASDRRAADERAAEVGGALTSSEETSAPVRRYGSRPCNCFLEAFSRTHSHLRVGGGNNRELSLVQLAALSRRFECVHVCRGALFFRIPRASFLTNRAAAPMFVGEAALRRPEG